MARMCPTAVLSECVARTLPVIHRRHLNLYPRCATPPRPRGGVGGEGGRARPGDCCGGSVCFLQPRAEGGDGASQSVPALGLI